MRLCSSCAILPGVRHERVDATNAVHNLDDPPIDKEACERDGFLAGLRMCRLYNSTGTALGERSSQAQKEFPCPILLPLMKFDDQKPQPGIEALAGSIRLKARLLVSYYRI
jgi:hypothetical protein